MLIKGILHYQTDKRYEDFLQKKILEFINGYVSQNVLGVLTDMSITERRFECHAIDKNSIEIEIDTFGVDLEEEESEEVNLSLRESFASIIDSPFIDDDYHEVFMKEVEIEVQINESESGGE